MKKSILTLVASTFITGTILTSCSSPAQKVENAENNVMEANQDLDKANEKYLEDIETYRKESADKIAANDKSIAEFKTRIANEKKEAKADYENKIAKLEQKNSDMEKKMDNYQAEGNEKWESFKREFNHDMDELEQSLKDLTKNNVK